MPFCRSVFAFLMLAAAAAAQDGSAASTGQEGQLVPAPFPSFAVTGPRAKFVHDLFIERELDPTVAVIATSLPKNPTEPLSILLQKLETRVAENKAAHFGAFAIFLTLDKSLSEDPTGGNNVGPAEGLAKDLKLKDVVLGLESPGAAPLAAFGIDKDKSDVTVLVYNKHKIERRFTFTKDKPLTEAAVEEILAATDKMLPAKKAK
ncbi:MAG: hypothetical protein ACJ8F7_14900 [Gemmataceae bacterium]